MIAKRIIIHHSKTKDSETVSWGSIRTYHTDTLGWLDIGYHFGIEQVSGPDWSQIEILMGRMPSQVGAHTKWYNRGSIGICLIGDYDTDEFDQERKKKLVELLRWLMLSYGIGLREVYGHRDFNPAKSCPGENLYRFLIKLKGGGNTNG